MIGRRQLGRDGPAVGCLGYGAFVLEGRYGASDDEQARGTICRALDVGMNMIDTADTYGKGHNERLVGRAIADRRREAFLATKFGIVLGESETGTNLPTGWGFSLKINGKPPYVRRALDASLKRMGVDVIDLWYAHYPDPATPIEETVGAMAEGVRSGKVRYLGLSNVTAELVRRAHKIHPISAVQFELLTVASRSGSRSAAHPSGTWHCPGRLVTPRQRISYWHRHQPGEGRFPATRPSLCKRESRDKPGSLRTSRSHREGHWCDASPIGTGMAAAPGPGHHSHSRNSPRRQG